MELRAIVSKSKWDQMLVDMRRSELIGTRLSESKYCNPWVTVTAEVSADRFVELCQDVQATVGKVGKYSLRTMDTLTLERYVDQSDCEPRNFMGQICVWLDDLGRI